MQEIRFAPFIFNNGDMMELLWILVKCILQKYSVWQSIKILSFAQDRYNSLTLLADALQYTQTFTHVLPFERCACTGVKGSMNLRNPRNTSPSASARVFPCSSVMDLASSFCNIRGHPRKHVSVLVLQVNINTNHKMILTTMQKNCDHSKDFLKEIKVTLTYNVIFDHLLIA